ncbi:MAG: DUF1640 domain-containing protein [Nitrospirae bacterium]|nr:DUF1640 domain-containing protein [Nitrospirota bacterium]
MAAVLFDTLRVVESLRSSGFSEEQAKGLSEALKVAQETSTEGLATKADLEKVRLELKADIESVKAEIEKSKLDSIKWMLAFWATQIGIMIAALKFFVK